MGLKARHAASMKRSPYASLTSTWIIRSAQPQMSRRSQASTARDIVGIVARLPWWGGVLLAIGFYLLLHSFSNRPVPGDIRAGEMAVFAVLSVVTTVGQYLLPFLCLAGAATSAYHRAKCRKLLRSATGNDATQAIAGMDWRDFEKLLAEGFRRRGFQARETGGGADGGIDLVLQKGREKFLVQCKHWRAFNVGVDVVRELYGVMAASGATGGYVVTSGKFTQPAVDFAAGRNIELLDGSLLQAFLRDSNATVTSARNTSHTETLRQASGERTSNLACPSCGKPMIRRTAKRGANAGSDFWGCTDYPNCRHTRPIEEAPIG